MQDPVVVGSSFESLQGQPSLVAIGNFDGVHKGHQAVLKESVAIAMSRGVVPVALTFHPHPTVAIGRPSPACLTTIDRRVSLMQRIDPALRVIVQAFTARFASQTPEDFVRTTLVERLYVKCVRVGENFRFGAGRQGDIASLRSFGQTYGFEVLPVGLVGDNQGRFSSTRARQAIARGDLDVLREILGRPHALTGLVVEGQKRARHLGFPTANLAWVDEALPPHGVYCVAVDRLEADGAAKRLGLGICNIGVRPTVDAGFAVEAHILDFDGDLYGQRIRVHLIDFVRPERKFASLDELRTQIAQDVMGARQALREVRSACDAGEAWF